MTVVYTFSALAGALFGVLTWLRVAPVRDPAPEGQAPGTGGGCRRPWALPLCAFGLVGLTLQLLHRPFYQTLVLSLAVGPTLGLVAGWISGRINRH